MNAFGQSSSLAACTPQAAVARFLVAMRAAAEATYPAWRDVLKAGIDDCALDYDTRRAVFDIQPLADYYLAGVIGLEAAKIRLLFKAEDASELLAEVAQAVDAVAGRNDRLVSDFVFDIISHLQLIGPHAYKLPHDQVVKLLLQRMSIHTTPQTRHLLGDVLFRHQLSEPLARGVPDWWLPFRARHALTKAMTVARPAPAVPRAIPRKALRLT